MKRISFNPQFVNEAGNNLIPGKIHTIRQNFEYWKKFEGRELALFTWEGKPYRSKQKVFCVKRLVGVQEINFIKSKQGILWFTVNKYIQLTSEIAENDGFFNSYGSIDTEGFCNWFKNYKIGKMAILHFTDFRY